MWWRWWRCGWWKSGGEGEGGREGREYYNEESLNFQAHVGKLVGNGGAMEMTYLPDGYEKGYTNTSQGGRADNVVDR